MMKSNKIPYHRVKVPLDCFNCPSFFLILNFFKVILSWVGNLVADAIKQFLKLM